MKTLYEKILEKPKDYRRKLSYAITFIIGILMITVWLIITNFSMKKAFNFNEDPKEKVVEPMLKKEDNTPSFYNEQNQSLEEDLKKMINDNQKEAE